MEYNMTFQDNIPERDFNNRAKGTLNWIKENRDKFDWAKDPNAYEMTNFFLFGAKYAAEGQDINIQYLEEMWKIRSQDFANCGIGENNFVYGICEDSFNGSKNGRALVNDENSHHALRKMAGIGLYLKQQQRDGHEIRYDNLSEFQVLLETSRTLKGVHPELFEKYKFGENIEVIYGLLEKNLDEQSKKTILDAKQKLLGVTKQDREVRIPEDKTVEER